MRSCYCGQLNESFIKKTVELYGWAHRRRDHGGVIFIDLRDREGLVQIVVNPENKATFAVAEKIRSEFVLQIKGHVRSRPVGTVNAGLATGHVEVVADTIEILNSALPTPFRIDEYQEISEEIRLKYRYLDLRRPEMTARIKCRHRMNHLIRDYMNQHDFLEIETPILTKSTPEGARDYLVPSRNYPGQFYALPQSPQLFKQLFMVAGFDRYYQIVRCFRDEDLRADRQPEFTQLDVEMAFSDEAMIQQLMEGLICKLFKEMLNITFPEHFPRMTYAEAMSRYGSDKPDLRIPIEIIDVSDIMQQVDFKVFAEPAKTKGSRVAMMRLPKGSELSRKEIDDYTRLVAQYGAKGLAYIKVVDITKNKDGLQSPILKFLPDAVVIELLKRSKAENGDLLFFGADKTKIVNESLGALRLQLGKDRKLIDNTEWRPLWVVDFPMFEWDEKANRWQSLHHPFTAPIVEDLSQLQANPGEMVARAYDLVLNGYEIGGGSIRIHTEAMQQAVFNLLGINEQEAYEKFSHLLNAFKYGYPPHGGIAFGLDRIAMLMTGTDSIRDVIAFPKTQTAQCPLTNAPSPVSEQQLRELGLKIKETGEKKT